LFTRNVSLVIIGAECDLAVDALSKTLDLFEIELEEVHEHRRIYRRLFGMVMTIAAETVMQ